MSNKPPSSALLQVPHVLRIKMLNDRLNGFRYPTIKSLLKPAKVAAAERVVAEWEAKNEAFMQAQRDAHKARVDAIRDCMILGDAEKAVTLLRELDSMAAKKS